MALFYFLLAFSLRLNIYSDVVSLTVPHNKQELTEVFLSELSLLRAKGSLLVVIGGYFNIIRGLSEKITRDTTIDGLFFLMQLMMASTLQHWICQVDSSFV
jgi:hypothetical protein